MLSPRLYRGVLSISAVIELAGNCRMTGSSWAGGRYPTMLGGPRWRSQSQCRKIGLQMNPIELGERLGRWSSGRGPLPVLLAARLRQLIDEGELPSGEPLPPDRALASALAVGRSTVVAAYELLRQEEQIGRASCRARV